MLQWSRAKPDNPASKIYMKNIYEKNRLVKYIWHLLIIGLKENQKKLKTTIQMNHEG